MLGSDSLMNMYTANFSMIQNHKWSLTEIENMMPYEREIYMILLSEHVKEENRLINEQRMKANSR